MVADVSSPDDLNSGGDDGDDGRSEWWSFGLLVPELYVLGVGFAVVAGSLLVRTTYLTGYSVGIRLAALAFLAVEMLIPLAVKVDLWRRPDDPDFA